MGRSSQRLLAWAIAVAAVPCLFLGIGAAWGLVNQHLATRDAEVFVRETRSLVAKWRADPKVHSVEVVATPEGPFDLEVRFDVDDKVTYLAVEDDFFSRAIERRSLARFLGKLRSGERLGMNLGAAAQGMGLVGEALNFFACVALASVALPIPFLYVALRRIRRAESAR